MSDTSQSHYSSEQKSKWYRGLYMLAFLFLAELAISVLAVIAIIQFIWSLAKGEKHKDLTRFGRGFGRWLKEVVAFQTFDTEEKPFPWKSWPSDKKE